MSNPLSLLFFILFGIVLLAGYIALRRRIGPPIAVAAGSIGASILLMLLVSLTQGNNFLQAIFTALVVGGLISGVTLTMAYFFVSEERRKADYAPLDRPVSTRTKDDER